MSDQKDRAFVQHSIDTGLDSLQGNPFLAQRIMNQERTEQPVMKKKISFAFILAMILMFACAATAIAGAFNETFNTWLYRIWPEAATTLMPVNMTCEDNYIRLEVISAVADGKELYITYSMEDLKGDRLSTECSPVMYVDSFPDYEWEGSWYEKTWKEKSEAERYPELILDGKSWSGTIKEIAADRLGDVLGEGLLRGQDTYENRMGNTYILCTTVCMQLGCSDKRNFRGRYRRRLLCMSGNPCGCL